MIGFFAENIGTVAISLALIGAVSAIVAKMAADKKKGKCLGCDGMCGGCPKAQKADKPGL